MEEIETGSVDTESGGSEGSSSEASSQSSESGSDSKQNLSSGNETKQSEIDWSKAFEHPRFKEVIGQKNEALSKYQEMETRYKAMEQQFNSFKESQPKAPTETDQLIADLKKVDPRLANVIESQLKAAKTAEAVQQRLEAFEQQSRQSQQQQAVQTAVSRINQMHETNKVSPLVKEAVNNSLDLMYMQGKLNLTNLEAQYKEKYDAFKKQEDLLTRSIRESYVKDKTKDANVPTSVPKGSPAKPAQKALNVPKDKESMRAAVVKSFLKEQAATRDATNT